MTLQTIKEIRERIRNVRMEMLKISYMLEFKFDHGDELNESLMECHRQFSQTGVRLQDFERALVVSVGKMMEKELTVV